MRILVTGATGFVGGRLVSALRETDHDATVLVRDAAGYDAPDGVGVVEGDLLESDDCRIVGEPGAGVTATATHRDGDDEGDGEGRWLGHVLADRGSRRRTTSSTRWARATASPNSTGGWPPPSPPPRTGAASHG